MATNDNLRDFLTDIANAIREKTGIEGSVSVQDFSRHIRGISGGNSDDIYVWEMPMDANTGTITQSELDSILDSDVVYVKSSDAWGVCMIPAAKLIGFPDENNVALSLTLHASETYISTLVVNIDTNDFTWETITYNGTFPTLTSQLTNDSGFVASSELITINEQSIVGTGNLKVGYKPLETSTRSLMTLSPNIYYVNTNTSMTSLTISLADASDDTILNEYLVEFTTSNVGTMVSLPSSVKWANGDRPTFDPNSTYQISIVNNCGVCIKFA